MPNCPECERALRIKLNSSSLERQRAWTCPESGCFHNENIDQNDIIPISTIAESMAARLFFNPSSEQGKKQAKYRRIAGGINSLIDETFQNDANYLNNDELKALSEASRILERLASAAERAKKELKNIEQFEEQRVLNRKNKATKLIMAHFQSDDLITQTENMIIMLLMADNYYSNLPINEYEIESTIKRAEDWNKEVTQALTTFLNSEFKDACQKLGGYLSHTHQSIEELVNKSIEKRDECLKPSFDVLNMIEQRLKIEASKNVVSLKLVPKH